MRIRILKFYEFSDEMLSQTISLYRERIMKKDSEVSEKISNDEQEYTCPMCFRTRADNGEWCLYCGAPHEFKSEQHKQQWKFLHPIPDYPNNIIVCENCGELKPYKAKGMCKSCYQREFLARNLNSRIATNLRSRLYMALKGNPKPVTMMELVGCNIEELRYHLEIQFVEGMVWGNYGDWHIDHIIPLSTFDLTDEYQLAAAMNYKNLQPLWASDNRKKSNKYMYDDLVNYLESWSEEQ